MGDEISENLLYCCVIFSNIFKLWRGWLHKEQIWLLYPFGYWQIVKRHVWIVRGVPSNKTGWVQSKALKKVSKWFGNHWKRRVRTWAMMNYPIMMVQKFWHLSWFLAPSHLQEGDLSDYPDTKIRAQPRRANQIVWVFGKWWPESERFPFKEVTFCTNTFSRYYAIRNIMTLGKQSKVYKMCFLVIVVFP